MSNRTLCCKQVISHQLLKANRPINLTQYSARPIALAQNVHYVKKQYVGKSETNSSNRLIHYSKDLKIPDFILAYRHFQERNRVSNKHGTLIIIDKLTNTTKSEEILCQKFIESETFWI